MSDSERDPELEGNEEEPRRDAEPVDAEQPPRLPFPVVGIGASAGGIEAFSRFFDAMPPDSGLAFVIIQHLPPDRESALVSILSRHTQMPVAEITDGMPVAPNHVYVIRPGKTVTLNDGVLRLGEPLGTPRHGRPVDDFLRSLAEEQRQRAIAIVLSGMGSNGAAGAQMIKAVGGLCIAQDPESADFRSMPQQVIEQGYADLVLRPEEMPEALLRFVRHPYVQETTSAEPLAERERHFIDEILSLLKSRTRQDFRGYKRPTIVRRIQRRMSVHHIVRLSHYVQTLRQNPNEASALSDDLLIHVTGFFRDPEAWEALKQNVIVPLVREREADSAIRCWVTACSSGEEAYTLAMLLAEAADAVDKPFDIKIFATDMAERSLAHARAGVYPNGIESEISPERLERFFTREDNVYRVKTELRDMIVFAPQNVIQDPPFSRIDVCTCRNLLIYLEPAVQARLLSLLHFGIRENGVLFLGTSETVAGAEELFEPVDKRWRIFRRIGATRHGSVEFPVDRMVRYENSERRQAPNSPRISVAQLTTRALLDRYTPASVVLDRDGRVVFFHGDTEAFLVQPRGEPTRDLLPLVREDLRGVVRMVLRDVAVTKAPASGRGPLVDQAGSNGRVWVMAAPLDAKTAPGYTILSFERRNELAQSDRSDASGDDSPRLRDELSRVREELQRTISDLQVSNEELRASNEEITSINEELQSSNEELETSKEELQSLNEELTTVNAQLQAKIQEHETTSNDLSSLLSSTDIAVVFLDTTFRIRRYTPAVKDLLDLIPSDIGRPLANLACKFTDPDLQKDAEAVLERLIPVEREISSESGRWYVRRILPYRTADQRIAGVVITFVDISLRKRTELEAAEKARLLDLTSDAFVVRDMHNRVVYWNRGAAEQFGWSAEQALGKDLHALLKTEREPPLHELVSALLERDTLTGEIELVTRDGHAVSALCRWALDRHPNGEPRAILTTTTDITARKRAEAAARDREEQFRLLVEGARDFALLLLDPQGRIASWNAGAERLLGYSEAEAVGQSVGVLFTPEDRAAGFPARELERAARDGSTEEARWHVRKDGSKFFGTGVLTALSDRGKLRGFVKVMRDTTVRRLAEETLQHAAQQAEFANRMKDEFLATLSHELRTPLSAILLWVKLLQQNGEDVALRVKAVDAVAKSAAALNELVDHLLDTSRIGAGTLRVALEDVELGALVTAWVDAIRPSAEAKGLRLDLDVAADIGVISTAPDRVQQVVWNLLTNAVKFTPPGGSIRVSARREHDEVEIRVEDTGKGIAPEFRAQLFEPFRQDDASSTRATGGLGLGLAISKKLVEVLGGEMRVESAGPGMGSTFSFTLPAPIQPVKPRPPSMPPPMTDAEASLDGLHVLVVEDTQATREAFALILSKAGARVTTADSAAAGFDAYRREAPDLIVSDVAMPDEDGYSLMRRIRAFEASEGRPRVRAIAVTALARDSDHSEALRAGFELHIAKPITAERLLSVVRSARR